MSQNISFHSPKQTARTSVSLRPNHWLRWFRFGVRPLALLAVVFISATLLACQVPVFRYALERWNADQYKVIVLHDGQLGPSQTEAMATLKKFAEGMTGLPATVSVQAVDVKTDSEKLSAEMQKAWKNHADSATPLMLVHYPKGNQVGHKGSMYQAGLTEENVRVLFESPVRTKLAKRLSAGDSAVWIFVPCGRKDDDDAALSRLEKQLKADAAWLELPSAEELEVEPEVLENAKVPLRIQYSTLTLSRQDAAEAFLLQSLLHSEEDLMDFDEPLAFPVFGRGRVLYGLVGKGISPETVRSASTFLTGPCSCQVKNQNPGFDLLLPVDWSKAVGDVLISEPIQSVDTEANAPRLLTIPPGRNRDN